MVKLQRFQKTLSLYYPKTNLQTSFIAYVNVSMTINFDKDEPAFKIIGQDLIDVPMLHLALLITSHMEMKIKKCEFCNELSILGFGNLGLVCCGLLSVPIQLVRSKLFCLRNFDGANILF